MPWWQPVRTVVTIDTIPGGTGPGWPAGPTRSIAAAAYRRASAIMTVSDWSRDVLARWPQLKPRLRGQAGRRRALLEVCPIPADLIEGKAVRDHTSSTWAGRSAQAVCERCKPGWGTSAHGVAGRVRGGTGRPRQHPPHGPHRLRDRLFLAPFMDENQMPRLYARRRGNISVA
jgi:hypothetical protein